jgi:predicted transcriptional regulator
MAGRRRRKPRQDNRKPISVNESTPEERHLKTIEEITRFLELELELTRTMLALARTENKDPRDPEGVQQAIENAQKALTTIFDFLPRLGQRATAEEIARTAQGLQAEVDWFGRA